MLQRISICLICTFALFSCLGIITDAKIEKVIIEKREHEYLGKAVESKAITDKNEIDGMIETLNDGSTDILKFEGKYYLRFISDGREILTLRANGNGSAFEIIRSEKRLNFKYFTTSRKINLEGMFL